MMNALSLFSLVHNHLYELLNIQPREIIWYFHFHTRNVRGKIDKNSDYGILNNVF